MNIISRISQGNSPSLNYLRSFVSSYAADEQTEKQTERSSQ